MLREGDLISLDCGAILDGWHGDSAITVGRRRDRSGAAADGRGGRGRACGPGIAAAARGVANGRGRLTDISFNVEKAVRKAGRYGIVDGYGGHGIGTEMHQDPHVLNHGKPGKGPRLVVGMALAIEPMITMGSPRTVELDDGWTVVTRDGSVAAHVEHTMALLRRRRLGDHRAGRRPGPARRPGHRPPADGGRPGMTGAWTAAWPAHRSRVRADAGGGTGVRERHGGRDEMRAADADRQAVADRAEGRRSTRAGSTCTSTTSACSGRTPRRPTATWTAAGDLPDRPARPALAARYRAGRVPAATTAAARAAELRGAG